MTTALQLVLQGKATAALHTIPLEPHSLARLCLCIFTGTAPSAPSPVQTAINHEGDPPELVALKAAFLARSGEIYGAARELRESSDVLQSGPWARRFACAAASLMARDGDRRSAMHFCRRNVARFTGDDLAAALLHSTRLHCELGHLSAAVRDLEKACESLPGSAEGQSSNAAVLLAQARVLFAQGNTAQAAAKWQAVLDLASSPLHAHGSAQHSRHGALQQEHDDSQLCALALASVVGDLGDAIAPGSRLARMEAVNNLAVCALSDLRLDDAVGLLEAFCKSEGLDKVDGIIASNLRTLYDLARTPDASRLALPPTALFKMGGT
jgi:tetratricopeptide (TPR) repeat protein